MEVKVAIDCMGGDHGVHVTVPAALSVLKERPGSRRSCWSAGRTRSSASCSATGQRRGRRD